MVWMNTRSGPFGPGFFGYGVEEQQPAVYAADQGLMKRQERRGTNGDGDLLDASEAEEERLAAQEPIAQRPGPHSFAVVMVR